MKFWFHTNEILVDQSIWKTFYCSVLNAVHNDIYRCDKFHNVRRIPPTMPNSLMIDKVNYTKDIHWHATPQGTTPQHDTLFMHVEKSMLLGLIADNCFSISS